jgi:hypothetical protein
VEGVGIKPCHKVVVCGGGGSRFVLVTAGLMVLAKAFMNLGGFIKRPEFLRL